jgi:glutathione S-transferase
MKPRVLLRQLGIPFETVLVDLFSGEARQPEHLARNPDGRVPVLETVDGDQIPESGAILLFLADGTHFMPFDRLARARVHQWMFFEQNQIEANIAVARFMALTGRAERHPEVFADRQARGRANLEALARGLADGRPFIASDDYTVADIALHAYVHCAPDAGLELDDSIRAWIERVEATPGFVNDLAPIPPV